ncbi:unnamed protein product [Natator depressus]
MGPAVLMQRHWPQSTQRDQPPLVRVSSSRTEGQRVVLRIRPPSHGVPRQCSRGTGSEPSGVFSSAAAFSLPRCPGGRSHEHLDLCEPERVLPPLLPCPRGTHRPLWLPAAIQVLRAKDLSCGMDQAQKCQIHINSPLARMLTQH